MQSQSPWQELITPRRLQTLSGLGFEVVDSIARYPASREREFSFVFVKPVPGTGPSILYVCLGNGATPTAYNWVEVASG